MVMARILICDDAAFMRTVLRKIVEKHGHTVVGEADNGLVAVSKYKELRPDVTTMDITMPEIDGLQALREIVTADPGAKVIMVSAMGQLPMIVAAIQSGAKDFLVKPFDEERVVDLLNKLLEA